MPSSRDKILTKLRNPVHKTGLKPDFESPVYHSLELPPENAFKTTLEKIGGKVFIAGSDKEFAEILKSLLAPFNPLNLFCFEDEIQAKLKNAGIEFNHRAGIHENIEAAVTGCEFLIAYTGSVMVSSAQKGGRPVFVYPPVHIVIASKDKITGYPEEAYSGIFEKYKEGLPSHISLITGPSRTADIEKTLVMGAHGPRELWVVIK